MAGRIDRGGIPSARHLQHPENPIGKKVYDKELVVDAVLQAAGRQVVRRP